MKKTDNVKHIPERGCHNCRLHCVNHRQCDSEYPCKQGMEWRPIIEPNELEEGDNEYYDLSGIYEEDKRKMIKELTEISAKHFLKLFLSLGLKTHIETMVVNEITGHEYILTFQTVEKYKDRTKGLNRRVLDFFRAHSYENYTPWEVLKALGINSAPITSIRRAVTDLTTMGYLVRTNIQRAGQYKELCYTWQII